MRKLLTGGLVLAAGLVGCQSTNRPVLFHRNAPEPQPCPGPAPVTMSEGPMLGEMPGMVPGTMVAPGPVMPPGAVPIPPGTVTMPPGTVTIPGPGVTIPPATPAPPIANPPVGPQPRTTPSQQTGKPTT
jgi:hypothetical protein